MPAVTDGAGQWLSAPQVGFGSYSLYVRSAGYDSVRTGQWTAAPGDTHDFGEVRLTRANGTLAGTVTDQEGKPLAGIRVYNSSETPTRSEATTDAEGRFSLGNLFPGRVFVFAESPGHLFTGACADTGATDVTLKLSPRPEVTGLQEPALPANRADEYRAARGLIDLALAQTGEQWPGELIGLLATVDLPEALRRSQAAGGQWDVMIARAMARALMVDDPDGALDWVEKIAEPASYARMTVYSVVKLAATRPELAQRQFARAMEVIGDLEAQPSPALYVARMALAMCPVDKGLAETAARTAAEMAEGQVPRDAEGGVVRAEVAEALALFDVEAALALVKDVQDWNQTTAHYERWVAAGCARVDPARAEEIMKLVPDNMSRNNDMLRVTCAIAESAPDRAVRLARQPGNEGSQRPLTLSWLALGVRPQDPARSWELFHEALACLKYDQMRDSPWRGTQVARLVALMAGIGRQIGYPLSEELAWRAAGMRSAPTSDMGGNWYMDQQLVVLLCMSEPALAKQTAMNTMARLAPGGDEWAVRERLRGLVSALALADPAGAPEAVQEMTQRSGQKLDPYYWAEVIRVLLADPSERLSMLARRGEGWAPGSDDLQW